MHGLILRAIQLFVTDIHGSSKWAEVVKQGQLEFDEVEAMLDYDVATGRRMLDAASCVLDRPLNGIYEDIGTYLVSHPNTEALRRLLRFGGVTFTDFLHSLDDLPERARLAVPNLQLPTICLREHSASHFSVTCQGDICGFGYVLLGILRTMADDYGALAFLEHRGGGLGTETLSITVLEDTFSEGRQFDLGAMVS